MMFIRTRPVAGTGGGDGPFALGGQPPIAIQALGGRQTSGGELLNSDQRVGSGTRDTAGLELY